ncbi:Yip1 family protein [Streptantibioticus silvisoli]|uniref:Yip1 family protein n=1 Tax=Streptantibioticus silvisoli TaxID=2705255 RepID=A0ABT6VVJ5_9ACTN|nr:Yip1 family protein [Streptantibioticus silvisoli]MDI5962044.1 Yip1 family protein [Streptantibioticus silvisoli]
MAGFRIGRGGPAQQQPQPRHPGQYPGPPAGRPPAQDDAPGHTRAFTVNVNTDGGHQDPYQGQGYQGQGQGYQGGYQGQGYANQGYPAQGQQGYGYPGQGYPDQGDYQGGGPDGYGDADGGVNTYRAGQPSAPPMGPRLPWQQLLTGIVVRPGRTFWQMRDYQVWGPALLVTFGYGLLAVFGFDSVRSDVLGEPMSQSVPWVVVTAVAVTLMGLVMGAVTHTLARQFGGDGNWAPTIGLAMLVASITDAPRLLFALFLGGGNGFVEILGWVSWLACGALMTSMVSKSHDLPWPKALGAASIQLIALLVLFKLPTL